MDCFTGSERSRQRKSDSSGFHHIHYRNRYSCIFISVLHKPGAGLFTCVLNDATRESVKLVHKSLSESLVEGRPRACMLGKTGKDSRSG